MTDASHPAAYPWRSPAVWMAVLIVALMLFNLWQATSAPTAFAERFGLEGAADADAGFVLVYASRTLCLALLTAVLLVTRQFRALGWFALVAVVMPLADAAQVSAAGGPGTTVIRHVAIAAYLLVTGVLSLRLARQREGVR